MITRTAFTSAAAAWNEAVRADANSRTTALCAARMNAAWIAHVRAMIRDRA